ncbi:DJ-1/PfpI/YhbO family deglycase/protease [Streptomyces sp. WMMB303]|uniref:DJ-1/PfpI/YhbO family deglycase/protease n=1 Tax=Streptomyces sp. WMMB303 TaxID=3034154 RepID=UPI0023ED7CA6|nr:DJ-1/PfpI/YhbO family deglycase/protease [Streptomyces sp. WMMB303]MDF4250719.1 DJ-1/PfpI/YhbO family deglycase/protease [Streptomyces sp. WMMB303]
MTAELHGTRVALLATDGVERIELEQPRGALHGAGARTEVIALHTGEINARQMDIDPAGTLTVDRTAADASADDYDALLLPGGAMNPDQLRTDPDAVGFAREFMRAGKPVAAICHGPLTLVEAEVVRGRRLTSWPSIRTDLRNAGAEVVEEEVVIDGNLVTTRGPDDLPVFCAALVAHLARTRTPQFA